MSKQDKILHGFTIGVKNESIRDQHAAKPRYKYGRRRKNNRKNSFYRPARLSTYAACAVDRDFAIIRAMKMLAAANYDFEKLITEECLYVDKTDKRLVTLIGVNFSAKKRNIGELLIENI